jgi:hypothetical protein
VKAAKCLPIDLRALVERRVPPEREGPLQPELPCMLSSVFSALEKKFKLPIAILLAPNLLFNKLKFFPFSLPIKTPNLREARGLPADRYSEKMGLHV